MAYREREMVCPQCGGKLIGYPAREKWRCSGCGGVLCGPDEVPPQLSDADTYARSKRASAPLGCTRCGQAMRQFVVSGIEVERCMQEGYVWFDAGELGYLRAYFAEEP